MAAMRRKPSSGLTALGLLRSITTGSFRPEAACHGSIGQDRVGREPGQAGGTSQPGIVFPLGAVVVVYTSAPSWIAHVWPVVLIEAWGVLQPVLVGIKDEAFVHRIQAHLPTVILESRIADSLRAWWQFSSRR